MTKSKRRGLLVYVALTLVCFTIWFGLVLDRYRSGQNFLPVHVRVSGLDDQDGVSVYVRSVHGSFGTLVRSKLDPLLWDHSYEVSSVNTIIVSSQKPVSLDNVTVQVRVGQSWVEPSVLLRVVAGPVPADVIPPGELAAVQFSTEPFHKSRISSVRDAVNWSGDLWLFVIPLLQLACLLTGAAVLVMTLRNVFRQSEINQAGCDPAATAMSGRFWHSILCATWLSAVFLLLHQVWWHLLNLREVVYVEQFCSLIAAIIAGCFFVGVFSYTMLKIQRRWLAAVTGITLIGLVKCYWIASVETLQFSDYGIYWDFGRQMASDGWSRLADSSDPLRSVLVERSYSYFYLVAKCFGDTQQVLEVCNVVTQMLTAGLMYIFVRLILGHRIAVFSLPLLIVHPDFWFASTVASHDTPGFLWLICSFVIFEFGRRVIEKSDEKRPSIILCVFIIGILLGIVTGFLDLQRGFGPMVSLSLLLAIPCAVLTSQRGRLQTGMLFALMVVCSMISSQQTRGLVRRCLVERVGEMGSHSALGYVTAVETSTNANCDEMQPWRFLYYPAIPEAERTSLSMRKLWYEKIGAGSSFWRHVLRKNGIIGSAGGMVTFAYGGRPGIFEPDTHIITWSALKYSLSSACELILKLLFIVRLLSLPMVPPSRGEIFPLMFSVVMNVSLLLVAETNATYDAFLAFPMAWSGGVVLDRVFGSGVLQGKSIGLQSLSSLSRWCLLGMVFLVALFTAHASVAAMTKRTGYTFFQPEHLESRYEGVRGDVQPLVEISDVSVSLTYPLSGQVETIPAGERMVEIFRLRRAERPVKIVRFCLAGNQRLDKVLMPAALWDNVPATYSVFLNNELVSSGRMGDLSVPIWLDVSSPESISSSEWKVVIEFISSWKSESQQQSPSISIEYIH
jgi:hypothetical protein